MGRRARVALILIAAAVGGAGTMTVELAAVRLLAPWFGSSLVVWTNVIAVVLLGLALGYLAGGRLSRGGAPLSRMGWALCLAAAVTALLPALAPLVESFFLPQRLALEEAAGVVLWGSLAASLLLFLPPAALLGTVAPLAVEAVARCAEGGRAGQAGGLVLCTSTLGSLAGVFGTSHLFLPALGLSGTYLVAGGALAAAGGLALFLAGSTGGGARLFAALVALSGIGAGGLVGEGARPELGEGMRLLEAAESPYQSVRVVEAGTPEQPLRLLQVNEGFDSYQSVWQPAEGLLPLGYYYNDFALPAWWAMAEQPLEEPWRVVVLGLGGGTAFRVLRGASPPGVALDLVGVELDPEVVRLARAHLDLEPPGATAVVRDDLDARVALRAIEDPANLIVLDCYTNQVEIPPHLCTVEFFEEIEAVLAERGWLVVNLGGFGFDDPVVAAVSATCAVAFEAPVLLMHVPFARNYTLIARRRAPLPVGPDGALIDLPAPVHVLLAPRELSGSWRLVTPENELDAPILRDGRCPIEKLQRRSIAEARARLVAAAGGA